MKKENTIKAGKSNGIIRAEERILLWQRHLADYLNQKCRDISANALLALLTTFCTATSVCLLRLIINAIY